MRDQLRKVVYDNGEPALLNAYFHSWGTSAYLNDESPSFQVSIAIIELEDGSIAEVFPRRIHFVESF